MQLKITRHARKRLQQRGSRTKEVAIVMSYADIEVPARQGCRFLRLSHKAVASLFHRGNVAVQDIRSRSATDGACRSFGSSSHRTQVRSRAALSQHEARSNSVMTDRGDNVIDFPEHRTRTVQEEPVARNAQRQADRFKEAVELRDKLRRKKRVTPSPAATSHDKLNYRHAVNRSSHPPTPSPPPAARSERLRAYRRRVTGRSLRRRREARAACPTEWPIGRAAVCARA
jgi:hypothetical protein